MSAGTCLTVILCSVILGGSISDLAKIGRPRNEYDDYVQAMIDIQKLRSWDGEVAKCFDSPTKINSFVDDLQNDLRERFIHVSKNKI